MGWSIGFDADWNRDIGYGVVAYCDHPECDKTIDRGLAYVCKEQEPRGGDGCGLYFCEDHQSYKGECERCQDGKEPFAPKPEHPMLAWWKMNAGSWKKWRSKLSSGERNKWEALAKQFKPTEEEIKEAKEDE